MSSQWETLLQCNAVSYWLGANLESALYHNCCWLFFHTVWFEGYILRSTIHWESSFKKKSHQCQHSYIQHSNEAGHIHKMQTNFIAYRRYLTHWGRVMYICVSKLTIIGSENALLPGWCKAIIWTNAWIWSTSHIFIQENAIFQSVMCKMAAILSRPQCVNYTSYKTKPHFIFHHSYIMGPALLTNLSQN